MPFATFTRVREVSSEDNAHLAENLIKIQSGKKWKTKNAGEKSAYVILEMSGSYQITGIDIGNEHSAFVEVLVGKSTCAPDEFKEILITCSFMTPPESKSSNNINRVRCFNREALVPSVAEEKWTLVKILCTQPFNKHTQYGLSFIKVHIDDNMKNSSTTQQKVIPEQVTNKTSYAIGNLKFREDSPDSESENGSSLFNRWKTSKHNDEQTTAALIRKASKTLVTLAPNRINEDQKCKSISLKKDDNILDRNRETLLFGDETEDKNSTNPEKLERLSAQIEADKKRRRVEIEKETNKKIRKSLDCSPKGVYDLSKKQSISKTVTESKSVECTKNQPSSSQIKQTKKLKPEQQYRPFKQLLKDVVLVISGIQNPARADLRIKAIALGATYKADWDSTCTHLICAFKNTPKYNQVKGKGKIVTKSWIEKCYSLKKYLPWRRYALESNELSKAESDEEIFDDTQNSDIKKINDNTDLQSRTLSNSRRESEELSTTLALYDIDDNSNADHSTVDRQKSSGSDTDDEIKRIKQTTNNVKRIKTFKNVNIYEDSTDEEDYLVEKLSK